MNANKAIEKYIDLLERDLAAARMEVQQLKNELLYYRAQAAVPVAGAQFQAVDSTNQADREAAQAANKVAAMLPSGKMPFAELRRRWTNLSEAEQNEAVENGWDPTKNTKEEIHEGQ